MTAKAGSKTIMGHSTILLLSSVLITLFLFYIDEGYYNFNWMTKFGNWVPFIVYVTVIFFAQLVFSNLLLKKYHGFGKTLLSIIGGTTIAMLVIIYGIFNH